MLQRCNVEDWILQDDHTALAPGERVPGPLCLEDLRRDTRLKYIRAYCGGMGRGEMHGYSNDSSSDSAWEDGDGDGGPSAVPARTGAVHSEVGQRQGPGHMVYIQP